jgi:hypothetical protein
MTIEEFWLPSKTPTSLDGDQNSLVAQEGRKGKKNSPKKDSIGPTPFGCHLMVGYVGWRLKFLIAKKKGGACNINFEKTSSPHALLGNRHSLVTIP